MLTCFSVSTRSLNMDPHDSRWALSLRPTGSFDAWENKNSISQVLNLLNIFGTLMLSQYLELDKEAMNSFWLNTAAFKQITRTIKKKKKESSDKLTSFPSFETVNVTNFCTQQLNAWKQFPTSVKQEVSISNLIDDSGSIHQVFPLAWNLRWQCRRFTYNPVMKSHSRASNCLTFL